MNLSPEDEMDLLIDSLNKEKKPLDNLSAETTDLVAVVRTIKSVRPLAEPDKDLGSKIYRSVKSKERRSWLMMPAAALAAGLLLFALFTTYTTENNPVYAMEKAVATLTNYHGILEVREQNANGEEWLVRRTEIWSAGEKYAVREKDGTLTVNNGTDRWQVRPSDKEVAILPVVPDSNKFGFDLRDEAQRAKQYPYQVEGQDEIAGRQATRLKISPPGGLPYYLWIDTETALPLQLRTALQNALQTTYTYISFEPDTDMTPSVFTYQPPEGYTIIKKDPGQQVTTASEAAAISRFSPLLTKETPGRIFAFPDRIVLDFGSTSVVESPAKGSFKPEASGSLGRAAGGPLEIIGESLRWYQKGVEVTVTGPRREELARQIAPDLKLPETGKDLVAKAQVKVPVDMAIVRADQQQVDAGHSPWQLDPLMVSHTFVNLQVSTGGIQGEPKIPESAFKLTANTGPEAIVSVSQGPTVKVYLKRLVRPDETGIWSVVGYDPR